MGEPLLHRMRALEQRSSLRAGLGVAVAIVLLGGVLAAGTSGDGGVKAGKGAADSSSAGTDALGGVPTGEAPSDSALPLVEAGPKQGVAGTSGTSSGGSGGAGKTGSGTGGGSAPSAPRGPLLRAGAGAKGVTDTVIKLGITTTDAAAASTLVGTTSGADAGSTYAFDYGKANTAAIEAVNATGGIAGRKVEPVTYFYNAAAFATPAGRQQENQRACAHWTEDNKVFAFDAAAGTEEVVAECAARTKTPWVVAGYHLFLSQRRSGSMSNYYFNPPSFTADRRERVVTKALVDSGFFGANSKVAIMIEDRPDTREGVQKGMKPVLAAAGIADPLEIVYPDILASQWTTYAITLRQREITHVLWAASSAPVFSALMMMRAVDDQKQTYKWGFGSDIQPTGLVGLDAPPEQLANVRAVGWQPTFDVGDLSPKSETGRTCAQFLKKHGQPEDNPWGQSRCEYLFFLQAALGKADELSPAGLAVGAERLGDSYKSTVTIGGTTRFGPGRHDGVAVFRYAAYDRAAKTFKYTSAVAPVPE